MIRSEKLFQNNCVKNKQFYLLVELFLVINLKYAFGTIRVFFKRRGKKCWQMHLCENDPMNTLQKVWNEGVNVCNLMLHIQMVVKLSLLSQGACKRCIFGTLLFLIVVDLPFPPLSFSHTYASVLTFFGAHIFVC